MDIQIHEAQKIQKSLNLNRAVPRHIITKLPKLKDKEKNLKAAREKRVYIKQTPIKQLADFSTNFSG